MSALAANREGQADAAHDDVVALVTAGVDEPAARQQQDS